MEMISVYTPLLLTFGFLFVMMIRNENRNKQLIHDSKYMTGKAVAQVDDYEYKKEITTEWDEGTSYQVSQYHFTYHYHFTVDGNVYYGIAVITQPFQKPKKQLRIIYEPLNPNCHMTINRKNRLYSLRYMLIFALAVTLITYGIYFFL